MADDKKKIYDGHTEANEAPAEATAPVQNTPTPVYNGHTEAAEAMEPKPTASQSAASQDWDDYMAYTAKSYDELIPQVEEQMNAFKPLTKAQLEKIRKRQRARSVMSGITDAVRSVANLVATHNYAPDMYDATNGMSARAKARFEKDKAERKAKDAEYYQLAMKLGHLKQQKAAALAGLAAQKHQQERAEQKEAREEQKAAQNELMFQLRYALQQGKLTEQGYRNAIAEVKANKIEELTDAQIDRLNRTSTGGRGGGRGGKPQYDKVTETIYDNYGKPTNKRETYYPRGSAPQQKKKTGVKWK